MQGLVSFPGVGQFVDCTFTRAHGISPSLTTLTMVPQLNQIAVGGDLTISFAGVAKTFRDCKVLEGSIERSASGLIWKLSIVDRRWKWAFGFIRGSYNLRHDDSSLIQDGGSQVAKIIYDSEKTPQELARLCLDAMGEANYDVSQLPNDQRPLVEWDYENPARALADLCDLLGCRVVLDMDDRVVIVRAGIGVPLPQTSDFIDGQRTIDPPERPDEIWIVCAHNRYQADLRLEAVGRDTDGQIKKLNDLSYKPTAGWQVVDLKTFSQITDQKVRELAKEWVYKAYRPVFPFNVAAYDQDNGDWIAKVNTRHQIQLEGEQVEIVTEDGVKRNKEAQIWGIWVDGTKAYANTATVLKTISDSVSGAETFTSDYAKKAVYKKPFTIDAELGLVRFSNQVYKLEAVTSGGISGFQPAEAEIVLRTAFALRYEDNRSFARYERRRSYGTNFGTKPRVVLRDDLVFGVISNYDTAGYTGGSPVSSNKNQTTIDQAADHYLTGVEQEYSVQTPESFNYAGLLLVNLDGAIQQITWTINRAGVRTTISRNTEQIKRTVPYKERRFLERLREAAAKDKAKPGGQTATRDRSKRAIR